MTTKCSDWFYFEYFLGRVYRYYIPRYVYWHLANDWKVIGLIICWVFPWSSLPLPSFSLVTSRACKWLKSDQFESISSFSLIGFTGIFFFFMFIRSLQMTTSWSDWFYAELFLDGVSTIFFLMFIHSLQMVQTWSDCFFFLSFSFVEFTGIFLQIVACKWLESDHIDSMLTFSLVEFSVYLLLLHVYP